MGLAVAQAQHVAVELARALEARGVEVAYAIHPVAGRMPGHMNVLLAEADAPYEELEEMEQANDEFPSTDVVLVVGANDVVNPAARDDPGSPIYGMPILNVDNAANVVFLKRSMRPGFSGVDNALLYDPKTTLLFGDAKESLTRLLAAVKVELSETPARPSRAPRWAPRDGPRQPGLSEPELGSQCGQSVAVSQGLCAALPPGDGRPGLPAGRLVAGPSRPRGQPAQLLLLGGVAHLRHPRGRRLVAADPRRADPGGVRKPSPGTSFVPPSRRRSPVAGPGMGQRRWKRPNCAATTSTCRRWRQEVPARPGATRAASRWKCSTPKTTKPDRRGYGSGGRTARQAVGLSTAERWPLAAGRRSATAQGVDRTDLFS